MQKCSAHLVVNSQSGDVKTADVFLSNTNAQIAVLKDLRLSEVDKEWQELLSH